MLSRQITPEYVEALCRMLDAALVAAISNYTAKNTEDGDEPSESEPELLLAQSRIRAGLPILAAIARSWHAPDQLFHAVTTPRVAGGAPDVNGLTECRRAVAIVGSTAHSRRVAIEMALESPDPAPASPTPLTGDFQTATSNLWIALDHVWTAATSDSAYTDSFGNNIEYLFWHLRNFYSALHPDYRQIPRCAWGMDLALARLGVPTIRALHRTAHDLVRQLRDDQIDPLGSTAFFDLSIAGLWPQVRKIVLRSEPDLMKVANMIEEAWGPLLDIEAAKVVGHAQQSGKEEAVPAEQDDEVTQGLGTQTPEQLTNARVFEAIAAVPASASAKEVLYARPNDDRDAPSAELKAGASRKVSTHASELSTEAKVAKVKKAMMDDLLEYGDLKTAAYYADLVGWGRTALYYHEPISKLLKFRRLPERAPLKGSKSEGRIECESRPQG